MQCSWVIHHVDVDDDEFFRDADEYISTEATIKESWDTIHAQVITMIPLDCFLYFSLSNQPSLKSCCSRDESL